MERLWDVFSKAFRLGYYYDCTCVIDQIDISNHASGLFLSIHTSSYSERDLFSPFFSVHRLRLHLHRSSLLLQEEA